MATMSQLQTALVNADKAGDMDAARKLAQFIKAEKARTGADKEGYLAIPGSDDFGDVPGSVAPKPDSSLGEKVVGAGETALSAVTGATAGTVAMGGGLIKGIIDEVIAGKFGSQEAADRIQQQAEGAAGAVTYAPRTEAGQNMTEGLGEVMQAVVPLTPLTAELGAIGAGARAVRPIAGAAVREGASAVASPIKQAAATLAEQVKSKIVEPTTSRTGPAPGVGNAAKFATPELQAAYDQSASRTAGTGADAGAAAVDMADLRQNLANELPIPIKLTEGQKTRAFEAQRFERETAKQGEIGQPLRERFEDQNLKLQQNMDAFIDSSGAELTEARGVGEIVDKALRQRATRDKTKIRTLYKEAEKSGEMKAKVDMAPVLQVLKDSESAKSTAPVLGATEAELQRLSALNYTGRGEYNKLTLGDAEQLRKFVNKVAGSDSTNIKFARDIKEAIDASTEGQGGELYKKARAARAQYANDYENVGLVKQLINTKRGSTDRAIAMEDVLRKSVISPSTSLDTVTKLRQLLDTEGTTGKQAWKELQGGTLRHIKEEALKGISRDSAGNQVVSASALDKVINQLDRSGKLDYIFGRKQAEQLRTINEVAKDVLTAPPGVVNTSNTATVLAGLIDAGVMGMTGIPAPVASVVRLTTSRIKDAKLRARVKQSLGE